MTHSLTGLLHLIAALTSMLFGTWVLFINKGTYMHRNLGYLYTLSMLILNSTAFMLYDLFGTFGPFHFAALVSLVTLLFGFIPAFTRKPLGRWLHRHLTAMYFSVVGLYCAFCSEVLTRLPRTPFFGVVAFASIAVTIIGIIIYLRLRKKWISLRS